MSFLYIDFTRFSYLFEISYSLEYLYLYLYLLQSTSLCFLVNDKKVKKLLQYFLIHME